MTNWELIKKEAISYKQKGKIWTSFFHQKRYRVLEVGEKVLTIKKVDRGFDVKLSEEMVNNAFSRVKDKNRFTNNELSGSVARKTAIVILHPELTWIQSSQLIVWKSTIEKTLDDLFNNANKDAKDDELRRVQQWVNQRKNQSAFRKNVLNNYNRKCIISKTNVTEVLEATHIFDHATSGINKTNNGILLRADLHSLFDNNLLKIHPEKFIVYLDKSLMKTEYKQFNKMKLDLSKVKEKPNKEYLRLKWENQS